MGVDKGLFLFDQQGHKQTHEQSLLFALNERLL